MPCTVPEKPDKLCGEPTTRCVTINGLEPLGTPNGTHVELCAFHRGLFEALAMASRESRAAMRQMIPTQRYMETSYEFHEPHDAT